MVVSKEMEEFMVADGGTETTSTYRRGARWDGACDKRLMCCRRFFCLRTGRTSDRERQVSAQREQRPEGGEGCIAYDGDVVWGGVMMSRVEGVGMAGSHFHPLFPLRA